MLCHIRVSTCEYFSQRTKMSQLSNSINNKSCKKSILILSHNFSEKSDSIVKWWATCPKTMSQPPNHWYYIQCSCSMFKNTNHEPYFTNNPIFRFCALKRSSTWILGFAGILEFVYVEMCSIDVGLLDVIDNIFILSNHPD